MDEIDERPDGNFVRAAQRGGRAEEAVDVATIGRMDLDMIVTHSRGDLKAKVTGTTASPSIRVSPSSVLRDVDPQQAEKGIKDLLKRFGR